MKRRPTNRRIAFDIETEPFSVAFKEATTLAERVRLAPRPRLACLYDGTTGRYRHFLPDNMPALVACLKRADEVISFNGKRFDLPVLRRHHGLTGPVPAHGQHTDLCEVLEDLAGFRVSLNQAATMNLGEGKHTLGRDMAALDMAGLKVACQSDVRQTYELWKRHRDGTLQYPRAFNRREADLGIDEPSQEHPVLEYARVAGLRDPDDPGEMTDGEEAEYLALVEGGGDPSWAADFFGFELPARRGGTKKHSTARTKRHHKRT
ncbi:MAG: hypothetical protein EDX89_16690 [Acidobacteria bacterium]|nr:MAG: hypothetical protein EDX89_16690 [Acidobacteriota bacterium]